MIDRHPDPSEKFESFLGSIIEGFKPHLEKLQEYLRENEEELGPHFKALENATPELVSVLGPYLAPMAKQAELVGVLDDTGWLPFGHAPYHCVEQCGNDADCLDACMSSYYRKHWSEIRRSFEENLDGYHVDDETKAAFHEALQAHEACLYRCVVRSLFPEIERVLRSRMPASDHVGSKQLLQALVGKRSLEEIAEGTFFGFLILEKLYRHLHERVDGNNIAEIEKDFLPNRHAAVHGRVAYADHKHSTNMLVMTDWIFRILPSTEAAC